MGGLREHGRRLLHKGYRIVPIKPGTKNPCLKGWQQIEADDAQLSRWLSNGRGADGVGVLTAYTPCVDIDVQDADVVNEVRDKLVQLVGDTPPRVGMPPKMALYYRAAKPFHKMSSALFVDADGVEHRLEILGDGQQSVLFAEHPTTKKPYEWPEGDISTRPHEDLPELTEAKAKELLDWFNALASSKGWEIIQKESNVSSKHSEDSDLAALDHVKPPINKPSAIRKALNNISPDCSHDEWVRVGMGLHHEYLGGVEGFAIWDEWSAQSDKYPGTDKCQEKWQTFGANLERTNPVTAASILMMGKGDPLEEFRSRYVYVENGDLIADLRKPPQHCVTKYREFKNRTANVLSAVPAPTKNDPDKVKMVPVSDLWMRDPERKAAEGLIYIPNGARVVLHEGLDWVNTFYMPKHDKSGGDISVFLEHMRYLVPDEIDREWLVSWLAYNVQHPELRCNVTPLHVSTLQGTGRGWFLRLIEKLLGKHNVSPTSMHDFIDGNFNEFLADCLVCVIEEVREGGKRYELNDKLKDKIESPRLTINRKYGGKGVQQVFANMLMFSNHIDALALEPNDRRAYVIAGPDFLQDKPYYDRLYAALEDSSFVGGVYAFLMHRDISNIDFRRTRQNEARQRMIENAQSDTETLFRAVMQDPPFNAMSQTDFIDHCRAKAPDFGMNEFDINEVEIKKLLKLESFGNVRLKHDGVAKRVWALTKEAHASNDIVREALDAQKS